MGFTDHRPLATPVKIIQQDRGELDEDGVEWAQGREGSGRKKSLLSFPFSWGQVKPEFIVQFSNHKLRQSNVITYSPWGEAPQSHRTCKPEIEFAESSTSILNDLYGFKSLKSTVMTVNQWRPYRTSSSRSWVCRVYNSMGPGDAIWH